MSNHEQQKNEKATIQAVKRQLQFLSENAWILRQGQQTVEDSHDLMDFISYTRSVIMVNHDSNFSGSSSPIIEAMRRQENMIDYQKQRQQELMRRLTILIQAIDLLPWKEKRCVSMKYIMNAPYQQMARELDISFSSIGRILRRAYLHLAQLLELEIYDCDEHTRSDTPA